LERIFPNEDMTEIPVHHLPHGATSPTRVEYIRPVPDAVSNGVHRHDFHELFFFSAGSGKHMIDLRQYSVSPPCAHVVAPGQVHQLARSADMEGIVVMFGGHALPALESDARAELFAMAHSEPVLPIGQAQLAEVQALVALMKAELTAATGPVTEVVQGYLGILLIKCAHWARSVGQRDPLRVASTDAVRRFLDLVERDFLQERQVAHYADRLMMSADHLSGLVKDRLGRTASKVIQDRLLLEAKRLLLHAELSIKEIGYALNVHDPAYFTRWFQKMEGMSPAGYREHIRDLYKR
jgi:AraC family transcriptional regulator, transcriptional activator of pobA